MTETQQGHRTAAGPAAHGTGSQARTGWLGWVYFAALIMVLVGFFHAVTGLVAMVDDTFYLVTEGDLVISVDYTVWGLVHLLIGVIVVVAGAAVIRGKTWGRTIGIIMAVLSAIANMAFIAAYPWWSIIIIALDVIVIYALAVHGREAQS
jgi:hypothetical protein